MNELTHKKTANPNYIVNVGKHDKERLDVLHELFSQATKSFLISSGLLKDMTVIDAGCGQGHVTIEMAKIVGPNGKIIAIDESEEQLQIARNKAIDCHLSNIQFLCASIDDVNSQLLGTEIDFIYGRFILLHKQSPYSTLKVLYNVLKIGGIMAFEEPDMNSYFAMPPIKAFDKAISWCCKCGKTMGLDYDIGQKLFFLMSRLGLNNLQLSCQQPVARFKPQKSIISLLTKECTQKYLEYQIASSHEIDEVLEELKNFENEKYTYIGGARQYQVFGIKGLNPKPIDHKDELFLDAAMVGEITQ